MFQRIGIILAMAVGASSAYAVDYDYERAYEDWQRQKSLADDSEAEWNRERQNLAPLQRSFERAQQDVARKESDLSNIRGSIRQQENAIASTENTIEDLERECSQLEAANRRLRIEIDDLHADHASLEDKIRDLKAEKRQVEDRISDLEGEENEENNAELDRLRALRDELARDISAKERELADCARDIRGLESTYQHNANGIANIERRLPGLRNDLRSMESQLRSLRTQENDTELALSRARNTLADARSARDRQQFVVDRAYRSFVDATARANNAYNYYQQVLNNYNNAMTAAQAEGRSQGAEDSYLEASERAAQPATSAATTHATRDGRSQGQAEAAAISHARGYRFGRDNASGQNGYSEGVTQGRAIAQDKALGESFPRGYNEALLADLSAEPSGLETIDITDLLPELPDEGGALLSSDQKSIRQVREPSYGYEQEPGFQAPEPVTQSVTAPAADRRYFAPECGSQPLPVFEQACRDEYQTSYIGGFGASYQTAYNDKYKTIYRSVVPDIYREARDQRDNGSYAAGLTLGATHQGILDGFAQTIGGAVSAAYARGQAAYAEYEQTGYLPLVREVSLDEGYEDGNLSPGEAIKLKIKVDNFGAIATSPEKLAVKIEDLSGGTFNLEIRNLPAMQADTTTVLEGVLQGQVTASDNGELRFKVTLLSEAGSVLDEAIFAGSVNSPIVLSRITFPEPVRIGEPAQGLLHVANRTERTTEATAALLAVSPEILELVDPDLPLPSIRGGEEVALPFDFIADNRAGGNLALGFKLTIADIAGSQEIAITKSTPVAIERNASIALCLPTCGAPFTLPLRVQAGSTLRIPIMFDFHSERRQPGPFVLGKLDQSDPRIRPANGSTVRVNLGSWSPNTSPYRATFGYVVPTELRGQEHWVSLQLSDGNDRVHLVEIPFIVE